MQTLEISATGKKKGHPLGKKDGPRPLGAKKRGRPPKKQVDSSGKNTLIDADVASNRLTKETVPVLGGNDDDGYWGDFDDHEGFTEDYWDEVDRLEKAAATSLAMVPLGSSQTTRAGKV